ncbi:MAG: antibiotic biosynthesis monooxygenase [Peptostreptococcaceae bacterium]
MFIEQKTIKVKNGFADKMIEKFSNLESMQSKEGFIECLIMKGIKNEEIEEVVITVKWDSQQNFTKWKTSDEHKVGHQNKEKQDFVISGEVKLFEVKTVKEPIK